MAMVTLLQYPHLNATTLPWEQAEDNVSSMKVQTKKKKKKNQQQQLCHMTEQ